MHNGPFLARLARRTILDVRQEANLREHLAVLVDLGALDPGLLVDLAIEIARHVPDEAIAAIVTDGESATLPVATLIHREAHRRHDRGDRGGWITWGERAYHCARQRRRRQRSA